jgi:hypothetical protein
MKRGDESDKGDQNTGEITSGGKGTHYNMAIREVFLKHALFSFLCFWLMKAFFFFTVKSYLES